MKIAHVQTSFSGGMISPHIARSRTDLKSYRSSMVDCCNYIPTVEGALYRRPRAKYFKDANIQEGNHRLFSSTSHDGKSFVFEFGRKSLAVIRLTDDGAYKFPIIATPYGEEELEDLNFTSNIGLSFKSSIAGELGDKAGWCIVHPNHPPHLLGRINNGLVLSLLELKNGAYLGTRCIYVDTVKDTATMSVKISDDVVTVDCSENIFKEGDINRAIRVGFKIDYEKKAQYLHWYWGTITKFISKSSVQVLFGNFDEFNRDLKYISSDLDWVSEYKNIRDKKISRSKSIPSSITSDQTSDWNLGAFGSDLGYPSHVAVFKDRLVFAKGNRIYFSKIGNDKCDFGTTVTSISKNKDVGKSDSAYDLSQDVATSNSAYDVSIVSDYAENIRWMSNFRDVLLIGTDHGEWEFSEKDLNHRVLKQISAYGTNGTVLKVQKSLVFVQRSGLTLLLLSYNERDGYRISNLSAMVAPFMARGIKDICYQQIPFSVIWVLMNDGSLLGLTFDEEMKVFAWHRHVLGGEGDISIESITAVPSTRRNYDMMWFIANRIGERKPRTLSYIKGYPSEPEAEHFLDYGKDGKYYEYSSFVILPHVGDALSDPAIAYSKRRIKSAFIEAEGAENIECGVEDGDLQLASDPEERLFLFDSATSRAGKFHFQQTKPEHGIITGVIMNIDISNGGI